MRLIDADEAIRRIEANMRAYYEESSGGYYPAEAAVDEIDSMPPVDAVPVVQCEKCRYWHRYSSSSRKGRCNGLILYLNGEMETPEDFYCKDGEEK